MLAVQVFLIELLPQGAVFGGQNSCASTWMMDDGQWPLTQAACFTAEETGQLEAKLVEIQIWGRKSTE